MNYFEGVAKLLGLELEEEFIVRGIQDYIYKLTKEGLEVSDDLINFDASVLDFNGLTPEKITKLPWKPKENEIYWTISFMSENGIKYNEYYGDEVDKTVFQRGLG